MLSDTCAAKLASGNLPFAFGTNVCPYALPHSPRRLVEECISVTTADLRRMFDRKELLNAAADARPVSFRLAGNRFAIYLFAEPVSERPTLSASPVRIWMLCSRCRRRARKLYTFALDPGARALADLACRRCHNLVYQSQHCCKNRW